MLLSREQHERGIKLACTRAEPSPSLQVGRLCRGYLYGQIWCPAHPLVIHKLHSELVTQEPKERVKREKVITEISSVKRKKSFVTGI